MITQKTKRIALLSGLVFLAMAAVVATGVWFILQQATLLEAQVTTIATDQAQEVAFSRLQRLIAETEQDRAQLESYFLVSQSDSIDFLNYIDELAAAQRVELKTSNPTEVTKGTQTFLSVDYSMSGTLEQLENFIQLLELIPYVSQLQSLQLQQQNEVLWQATTEIDVILLNYE